MDAEKSATNLSANAGPSQLELHALPGNLRSLNIVSGQIRDDERAASSPWNAQRGACWQALIPRFYANDTLD